MKRYAAKVAIISASTIGVSFGLCCASLALPRAMRGAEGIAFTVCLVGEAGGVLGLVVAFFLAIFEGVNGYDESRQRLDSPETRKDENRQN